jgi:hypothetical protein
MFSFSNLHRSFTSMLEFMISAFTNELMKYESPKKLLPDHWINPRIFFAAVV